MRGKFEFNEWENQLVIMPENDNERTLTAEFLKLKPVGSKYVLRVPRANDGKTIVLEKKQYITRNFLKKKGFVPVFNTKTDLLLNRKVILFGFGTYWVYKQRGGPYGGELSLEHICDFYFSKKTKKITISTMSGEKIEFLPVAKIQTLKEYYSRLGCSS